MTARYYVSPNGSPIIGTLETIPGVATLSTINDDGEPNYDGETDIDWDGQETVERDGKAVFVDENGDEWTFDQLSPDDEDEDDEDEDSDEDNNEGEG